MEILVDGRQLAHRVEVAAGFVQRLVGLLGRSGLAPGEGLLLSPCTSIHTLGMRFPIDVLLLDEAGTVLRVLEGLPPWRIPAPSRGTKMVLELGPGSLAATPVTTGERIAFSTGRQLDRWPSLR